MPRASHAGIGLRSVHYDALFDALPEVGWLEVHSENYFCGGAHMYALERAREHYPISLHGIGLSLGSSEPVSERHLQQLKELAARIDPVRVSDHASWSASGNAHLNDLLPLPYTNEALDALCRNIDRTQEALRRTILVENPSTYLQFKESTMDEASFMIEAAQKTGCQLLLDINNIFVQAHNYGLDATGYIDAIPPELVGEMHLAGHIESEVGQGSLLIDTHNQPVRDEVWALFAHAVQRFGPKPTLIEWDKDLPKLNVLVAEAHKAETILKRELRDAA